MASEYRPGTLGYIAAWTRAEGAVRRLSDLADVTTPLAPVVLAAAERVRKR